MSEQALIIKIEFFEAHFKVHSTKGFRLTYPIPLPTTVAGIFAGMLGIQGREAIKKFSGYRFGAMLADGKLNEGVEQVTFLQYAKNRRGVAKMHILVNPAYYLAVSCRNTELKEIERKITEGIEYFPFGGQNDFFAKNWTIVNTTTVNNSTNISNYLYSEYVQELVNDVSLEILPVMHRLGDKAEFYFILEGYLKSKHEMPVCEVGGKNIALYSLNDFYPVGEWSCEHNNMG